MLHQSSQLQQCVALSNKTFHKQLYESSRVQEVCVSGDNWSGCATTQANKLKFARYLLLSPSGFSPVLLFMLLAVVLFSLALR